MFMVPFVSAEQRITQQWISDTGLPFSNISNVFHADFTTYADTHELSALKQQEEKNTLPIHI